MKRILISLLFIASITIFAQSDYPQLTDKILLGGDLGFTFTSSDYKNVGVGLMIRGVGEYYLYENESHKIGLRAFGGYGVSTGSDKRFDPDGFSTQLYTLAAGGIYSLQVSKSVAPYAFLGLRYLRFNPKDKDGNTLPNNAANEYDRNVVNLALEFGIRFNINNDLYGYGSLIPFSLSNDYIDDRASGSAKDFVVTLNFGLMYAFDAPWVSDQKKISDDLPSGMETEKDMVEENKIEETILEKEVADIKLETKELKSNEEIILKENADVGPEKSNIVEELSYKLDLGRVFFDYGKTELDRMEYVELDRLYNLIAEDNTTRWRITGYTDNLEPVQVHQSVAIQRAYFVLRYFMSKGIERERFEVDVKGEENPLASNDDPKGREKNRRVEVTKIK